MGLYYSAGSTSGTITIAGIIDDSTTEGNETVILTLSSPNNAILGVITFTYTIGDNDTPTAVFSSTTSSDSESTSSISAQIEIPFAIDNDINVDYALTGTATGSVPITL